MATCGDGWRRPSLSSGHGRAAAQATKHRYIGLWHGNAPRSPGRPPQPDVEVSSGPLSAHRNPPVRSRRGGPDEGSATLEPRSAAALARAAVSSPPPAADPCPPAPDYGG